MRYISFVLLFFLSQVAFAQSQPTTPATEHADSIPRITEPVSLQPYEGRKVTVVGRIVQVKYVPSVKNGPTFLNMHSPFPRTPFNLTIFERDSKRFPDLKETYEGEILEVTGLVTSFESTDRTGRKTIRRGIVIELPDQVKVVD